MLKPGRLAEGVVFLTGHVRAVAPADAVDGLRALAAVLMVQPCIRDCVGELV
jgi:hypothetical protein